MNHYAAFIRGIMPMNPNMRNEKLREVFESLGFSNVRTVISSGNVIFETKSSAIPALETKIEKALARQLGIKGTTIVRSKAELEKIIRKNPFKEASHGKKSYLIVTFMKGKPREVFNTLDLTQSKTPNFMSQLEKDFGKDITTRTWKTIGRIVEKLV